MEYYSNLILGALATFYLTVAITQSDGPYNVFLRMRNLSNNLPFECFICTALWVAVVLALFLFGVGGFVLPALAMAGAAVLLDRVGV